MTDLIDVLMETARQTGFLDAYTTLGDRVVLDEATLRQRLVLCLHGLGTNAGLKRVSAGTDAASYAELLHVRYQGRSVMIYWHMERQATCIYSQLKPCSSSEAAAMIEGVLRHCTDVDIQRHYVDTHGFTVTWTVKPGVLWAMPAKVRVRPGPFLGLAGAVSPSRPAPLRGIARSGGRGWPQATAGGGAQRPRRARARRHARRRRDCSHDHACMPMSASRRSVRAAVHRCRSTSRRQPRSPAPSASATSSLWRSRRRGA